MSKEIKCINVNNKDENTCIKAFQSFGWELKSSQRIFNQDTKPVSAITYDDVTYIRTRTETVDFTKLVFERDTSMHCYDEIVELEEEFWELQQIRENGIPYVPETNPTIEGWARQFDPDLRTADERKKIHTVCSICLVAIIAIAAGISVPISYDDGALAAWIILLPGIIMGIIWRNVCTNSRSKALDSAINNTNPKYRKRLELLWQEVVSKIETYDKASRRMRDILSETKFLLATRK